MVGAFALDHPVARVAAVALLDQLLEQRLVVLPVGVAGDAGDLGAQGAQHELLRRGGPGIEVVGADDRLHGISQDRLLGAAAGEFLAAPDQHGRRQVEPRRPVVQRVLAHHERLDACQIALRALSAGGEQLVADRQTEHRIAEELQLFVVGGHPGGLVRVRAVAQGKIEHGEVAEADAGPPLQLAQGAPAHAVDGQPAHVSTAILAAANERHSHHPVHGCRTGERSREAAAGFS